MEQLTPENVLSAQHNSWLAHPCTVQMLKNLAVYRESFIKVLTSNAANTSEPDVLFRINAYGIRTIDGVITSITSTTMFVEQSKKT